MYSIENELNRVFPKVNYVINGDFKTKVNNNEWKNLLTFAIAGRSVTRKNGICKI